MPVPRKLNVLGIRAVATFRIAGNTSIEVLGCCVVVSDLNSTAIDSVLNPVKTKIALWTSMTGFIKFAAVECVLILAAQIPNPANQPAESQKDNYAVFSAIISQTNAQSGGTYLIQDRTMRRELFYQFGCLQAPSGEDASRTEIQADYESRKNSTTVLTNEFTLSQPYQLLSITEVDNFLADALKALPTSVPPGKKPPLNTNPLYQKSKSIIRLGNVYFNKSRTRALTSIDIFETENNFDFSWLVFRKSESGQWEPDRSWRTCGRTGGPR
jgi:hypothetical protein